jgi:general secretion pathway protein A
MYLEHWQLASPPFESIVDRSGFYPCELHEAALLKLRYATEHQRGAVLLAGPGGSGKTMLVHLLREELDARFTPFVHVVFPQMSSRDLLVYLAEQLGAPPADPPRHTIEESVRRIQFTLEHNAGRERHAVVAIDEAQLLEDCGALETLRLLLNFEADGRPALTLLLVGDTNLVSAVGRLPSLEERVSVKTLLRAFTAKETAAYVRHRLRAAGATSDVFTPDAVDTLHELSHGLARQINRLADLALLVGYADRLPEISARQVEAVSEELIAIAG